MVTVKSWYVADCYIFLDFSVFRSVLYPFLLETVVDDSILLLKVE